MILAGDIGGTKCKLALFEPPATRSAAPRCVASERIANKGRPSLENILEDFLGRHPARITSAAFGVAGPVIGHRVRAANVPWVVEGESLERLLGLQHVVLLNDLEATGHGLPLLARDEMLVLNDGEPDPRANQALIAAGTGLGEAIIFRGSGRSVLATEGGHTDFAPRTDQEIELLRFLRAHHGRASWEHILSGRGFRSLHEFLDPAGRHASFDDPEADPAADITARAQVAACPACVQTLDLWARLYGVEAGNLAMKALARGGVYVAGGIAPKIVPKLRDGGFFRGFCEKGDFGILLARIPIYIVLNEDAPVLGAASVAVSAYGR